MEKLEALTTLSDNPDLIRRACFYVGWQLRSPDSWEYRDVFTNQEGVVTLTALIQATKEKREKIQASKNSHGGDGLDTINEKLASSQARNGSSTKRKSKR
jgi:hypothetical protein